MWRARPAVARRLRLFCPWPKPVRSTSYIDRTEKSEGMEVLDRG